LWLLAQGHQPAGFSSRLVTFFLSFIMGMFTLVPLNNRGIDVFPQFAWGSHSQA
jgi:hypothetical protein